jgi:hypothetical protein
MNPYTTTIVAASSAAATTITLTVNANTSKNVRVVYGFRAGQFGATNTLNSVLFNQAGTLKDVAGFFGNIPCVVEYNPPVRYPSSQATTVVVTGSAANTYAVLLYQDI